MILVFGGTTEGRIAINTLDDGEGKYLYSTASDHQKVECGHGVHISGTMTREDMIKICYEHKVRLIIDAAHPFAINLHNTIHEVANELKLPVIRFERHYPLRETDKIIWCNDYHDAVRKLENEKIGKLLALTGVNTIPKLTYFWQHHTTWFRVLDRHDSIEKAISFGFPTSHLIIYKEADTGTLINELKPDAIITKESGITGGFEEKVKAAIQRDIKVFAICRPKVPPTFITVDGRHGLRREIERLLPEFYPLHTGFTTGSCATAAAKAAMIGLLSGEKLHEVTFRIPEGETMKMDIESVEIGHKSATATVIKDSGDDPDITNGCQVTATVALTSHDGIKFIGGAGIGTVTLPGTGLAIGEPAINPVPRDMIKYELTQLYSGGVDVTIAIEGGDTLAIKTFNPKIGVMGGVSIIGTSGIVNPFSHEAFINSIHREFEVALAMGCRKVVINSGGRSERYMKALYPDLPPQAFISYGNAVGDTMKIAEKLSVPTLTIGLMIGKAVKLAEGHFDTHSHKITLNHVFLPAVASLNQCSLAAMHVITKNYMARELWRELSEEDADKFFQALLKLCHQHCATIYHGQLESVLIDNEGVVRYKIHNS